MLPVTNGSPRIRRTFTILLSAGITLTFENGVAPVVVDIGMNTEDSVGPDGVVRQKQKIVDIGDLSKQSSFQLIDAKGKSADGREIAMDRDVDLKKLLSELKNI